MNKSWPGPLPVRRTAHPLILLRGAERNPLEAVVSLAKAIVAAIAAVLAGVLPGLIVDQPLGLSGVLNIVALAAGAIQVYNAANIPGWNIAKLIASVVTAGVVVAISALSDGSITPGEWVQVATAVAAAVGVFWAPGPRVALTSR